MRAQSAAAANRAPSASTAELAAELAADLTISAELRLAYSPSAGRLWRLDAGGAIIRELKLWRWNGLKGRYVTMPVWVTGVGPRSASRVIWRLVTGEWPPADRFVDHRSRNVMDNSFANLRLCTPSENGQNTDRGFSRVYGRDQTLEQGVIVTAHGAYEVTVMGVHVGTFDSLVPANEECRKARRQLKGEFDIPFVSWRRMIRGA
jgi:hypothetical protein